MVRRKCFQLAEQAEIREARHAAEQAKVVFNAPSEVVIPSVDGLYPALAGAAAVSASAMLDLVKVRGCVYI